MTSLRPTDSAILSSIKSQISNGTKIYDINGELVSESLVSTDYYDVYWYVLKEGNSYWHVDGILEKKSQPAVNTYDVTYSWTLDCNVPGVKFPDITPPEKVTYAENDLVTPDYTYNNGHMISDPDRIGTWQFSGWSISNPFNITEDTEITGVWRFTQHIPTPTPTPVQYKYQIVYKDGNNSSIRSPESGTIEEGTDWDLTSKVPDTIVYNGITYNKSSVDGPLTGTNANADIVVIVTYLEAEEEPTPPPTPVQYKYQITYLNEDGVEINPMVSGYLDAGSDWDFMSKIPHTILYNEEIYDLEEIIDDQDVCGKNISSDITLVVKYGKEGGNPTPPTKTYSVRYEWTVNGGPGLPSTVTLPKGESHDRTFVFSTNGDYYKDLEVSVTGGKYVFSGWSDGNKSMMNGTMIREPSEQIEVLVEELVLRGTWEWVEDEVVPPPSTPSKKTYYKIEVEFVDANGNEIADEYSTTVRKNHEYDVTNKIPDTIMVGDQEYTLKTTTGDPLSGIANRNKKITAWYELKVTVPPVENDPIIVVPPVEPEETPVTPVQPDPVEPKEELDEVPKTGDPGIMMNLLATVSSISGALYLSRKKKDEE